MCEICYCSDYCGCNPTCVCCVVIPLEIGTVFAAFQVMLCGLSFPVMSLLFWPQIYILVPSTLVSVLVCSFAALLLINMKLKRYIIFRIVIYGVLFAFAIGFLGIVIGLNVDFSESSRELVKRFRKLFNFNTKEEIAFQMLQSIQIVYFSFLFFSYVYCGMVFQLYEIKHEKKRRRKTIASVEAGDSRGVDGKTNTGRRPLDGEPRNSKEPKEKKTVRIVLPDPYKSSGDKNKMKIKVMRDNVIDLLVFLALALVYIVEAIVQMFVPMQYRTKRISGDVVLITGGGGGLGRLLAERFSKLGCIIVVWDINKKAVDETVEKVKRQGGTAYGYVCDITNRERVYSVAKEVKKEVGKVSILINNAGMVSGKPFLETPDSLIQKTFDVNVISHFWTVKAFLPDMIDSRRGHIVTIASMAGTVGMTKLVDYCASKYAAIGFDESLRVELECYGHHNIHTTVICPYFIKSTGMFDGVHTRLIPILEAPYVADRIVQAVITNEKQVYLPGVFRALILLKGFVPWRVTSMFLRALVLDAHPDHIVNRNYTAEVEEEYSKKRTGETATESLEQTYRRSNSSSERKP